MPETIANRYHVLTTLGEGTMGLVWAVQDSITGSRVALKVISQQYGTTPKSILQLKQEFRLMTQLRHPNCCAVYDYGQLAGGEPYFTMEEVPGHGVNERIPMGPDEFQRVLTQLLLALGYVHQLGFVHRDVKAENVRIKPDGTLKLMDYGLMEYARRSGAAVNGTVAYLAPEIIRQGSVDQRSDLYAVGVLAYEMLTGRQPFVSDRPIEVVRAHLNDRPAPPSAHRPGLDSQHERLVLKLLEKNPLERYQSVHQVLEALGVEVPAGIGGNLLASPLLGREPELAMFKDELARLKAGETTEALLLHGPSGIGKSRLLEEFRYAVQLEDLPCVVGANHEQGTSPYAPFITVLKGLIPALKAHAPDALEQHAPVLVRLLPELEVPPADALDSPTKDKLRLQATILELLTALGTARGLVVILEDWQWADALSAELLDYLLRNMQAPATLFLITSRLGHEGQLDGARRVALTTLGDEGVRRMVTSMLGTPEVDDRFVAQVAELSKGVPFFVEKLLEHLVQDQTLTHAQGRWNTHVELPLQRLPNNLKGLLMWRITCLSESAQRVAHVGAVVGRAIALDVLKQVSGLGEDELFAALSSLAIHQIFVQDAEGAYLFAQDQIQELVYNNLEPDEKRRWHGAIAAVLESQVADTAPEDLPLELLTPLAHHFLEGGDQHKTIVYALEAGKRAAALFANAEAEHFLTAGLARLREDETGHHDRRRLEYCRALGDVFRVTGRNDRAKEAYLEAVSLAETLGERRMLGRMLTWLGRCHQVSGAFPDALAACERSLAICREADDPAGAARCLLQMGRIYLFLGNLGEATSHAERSLATARQTGDKVQIGEALAMLGYFYVASDPQKIEEGVENLHRALAFLTELDDKIALTTTFNFLGTAQNSMGHFQEAWASFSRNREICYEIGAKDDMIFALLNLAITAYELGNFAEMARWAQQAKSTATQLNSKYTLGMAITLDAVAAAHTGQMALTLPLIQEQLELSREIRHKYMETQVLLYQTEMLLLLGRLQEARAAAEALKALIAETGDKEPEGRLNTLLAEILLRLDDMPAAKQAADHALRHANATRAKGIQVRAQAVKAWIAMGEGSPEEARRLAEGTLVLANRIGSQYQLARLWGLLGELAAQAGKPDAGKLFREQATIADAMGLRLLQAEACYGQAACMPPSPEARALLQEAQATLNALAAELDTESRACFLSLPERQRILKGDLEALLAREAGVVVDKAPPPRLGLNQGIWNKI